MSSQASASPGLWAGTPFVPGGLTLLTVHHLLDHERPSNGPPTDGACITSGPDSLRPWTARQRPVGLTDSVSKEPTAG